MDGRTDGQTYIPRPSAGDKKESNSVNTGDRVMVLALCNPPHDPLSEYQVSLNSLVYFQRYALDKLLSVKIEKGSKSVNTGDWVTVLALHNSPHGPLSVYQVSLNYLNTLEICSRKKV